WRSRRGVRLSGKDHQLRRNSKVADRPEVFLHLSDRYAHIRAALQKQRRCLHPIGIIERGVLDKYLTILKEIGAKIAFVSVEGVPSTVVAHKIGHAVFRNRGLKAGGMANDPARHKSTVAMSDNAQPVGI